MKFTDIVDLINQYWGFIVITSAVLGIGIERSRWITFNPYSALFGWIGKRVNKDIKKELSEIEKKVDNVKADLDEHVIESDKKHFKDIRGEILAFAKGLRNGEKHGMSDYEHIFDLYQDYHNYIDKRDFENGLLDAEYEYIMFKFKEAQKNNDFID